MRLLRRLERGFASAAYDLVILIDYPGFHLRVAEAARRAGHPGALLHRAAALGLAAAAARRLAGAVEPAGGDPSLRASLLPGRRHPGGLRWPSAAGPRPPAQPGPQRGRALGLATDERVLGLFPGQPVPGDLSATVAASFRDAALQRARARR